MIITGRKNKRKKRAYRQSLGFNPKKYLSKPSRPPGQHGSSGYSVLQGRPGTLERQQGGWQNPHRGEIWFADLGDHTGTCIQSGCRPVFVISNNIGNRYSETINVLPMTSRLKKPDLVSHVELHHSALTDARQFLEPSMVLTEQITTINKSQLRSYLGRVEDETALDDIRYAIEQQLNLSGLVGTNVHDTMCSATPGEQNTAHDEMDRSHDEIGLTMSRVKENNSL